MGGPVVVIDPDLRSIIPKYMDIRRQELDELWAALGRGEAGAVRLLGHRLKGTGASYGFAELTRLGAELEAAGVQGDLDAARVLAREIEAYLSAVRIVYGPAAKAREQG
ncbi:MAG: Hpt domain-containing protein [Desulfovibrionaceae bacterium]|nr:Hpt domain-containing protein [Desulfovibrionaceae bacterium]MDD4952902.1 Hpt domain-containing protein [Desulfovibrionaceae bacterium]